MNEQELPPPPIAEIAAGTAKISVIIAAGQLGLFKILAEGPRSIPEIVSITGANETGVARLVEALASVGYLERVDDRYANGLSARTWLTPSGLVDFTPLLLYAGDEGFWSYFANPAEAVRRGGPERDLYQYFEEKPEVGRYFSQYMKAMAQLQAEPIARSVTLPDNARRLLDLGGSHGLYSIAFCRRNPKLKAIIFDFPSALSETEEIIATEGLADRISVQQGDFLKDEIGRGYDVVLCFNRVEDGTDDVNRSFFHMVARALNPGGQVIIYCYARTEPPDDSSAMFSWILFRVHGGRTYTYEEITNWLTDTGFSVFNRIELPHGGPQYIITAVRTG